jgi:hypothetical protein
MVPDCFGHTNNKGGARGSGRRARETQPRGPHPYGFADLPFAVPLDGGNRCHGNRPLKGLFLVRRTNPETPRMRGLAFVNPDGVPSCHTLFGA